MIPYMVGKLASNVSHLTRWLVKYVPSRGYFRAVPSQNGDKYVISSPPPQSLNWSQAAPLCSTSSPLFARRKIPKRFSFLRLFQFPSFPIPVLALYLFSRRGFSRPTPHRPVHLPSPGRIWCLLTGSSPSSHFPRRCCTALYCTVLYASFDVRAVGTSSLTCGFNWQCTADAIGYAVMITARLDSLPCPQSLPRFRSTPAGR